MLEHELWIINIQHTYKMYIVGNLSANIKNNLLFYKYIFGKWVQAGKRVTTLIVNIFWIIWLRGGNSRSLRPMLSTCFLKTRGRSLSVTWSLSWPHGGICTLKSCRILTKTLPSRPFNSLDIFMLKFRSLNVIFILNLD